jgi:glycosyltransferase involved in cell wall biosynthesis
MAERADLLPGRPVYYFTRALLAYRVPVVERLNRRLGGRLVVCSGLPPEASSFHSLSYEGDIAFRHVALPNYWLGGEKVHAQPFRRVFRQFGAPAAVLAEDSPRSVSLPLLLAYARRCSAGTVLWGHFSSNDRAFDPARHLFDRYRAWLAGRADACVCYTEGIADLLRPYVPAERLFVARNTLDTDVLFRLHDALAREGRPAVRRRLGLPEDAAVLLFIGRLVAAKGAAELLEVYHAVRQRQAAALVVIGDGPERGALEARVAREGVPDVHFTGALTRWEASAPYLYAADVMVQPGPLGLSVNHAFALGLPVVSRRAPAGQRFHGPEAEFVVPGSNGMLADPSDLGALVEAVHHVLDHQARFSEAAHRYAREHLTIDRMVDGLVDAITYAQARRA